MIQTQTAPQSTDPQKHTSVAGELLKAESLPVVRYGKLFNIGNYENERIEIEVAVEPDETADQTLARAKAWVQEQHLGTERAQQQERRRYDLANEVYNAQSKLRHVQEELRAACVKYDELRDLLSNHGVTLEPLNNYYRPKAEPEGAQETGEEVDTGDDDDPDNSM